MSTDAPKPIQTMPATADAALHPLQQPFRATLREPAAIRQRLADLEELFHGPEGRTIDYVDRHGVNKAVEDLPPEILRELSRSPIHHEPRFGGG